VDVASRSLTQRRRGFSIREATGEDASAPQLPETVDPVTEALEAAHAAAVAAKDWSRARILASELDARGRAVTAANVVRLSPATRRRS